MISAKFIMTAAAAAAGAWGTTGPQGWQLLCQAILGIVMSLAIFFAVVHAFDIESGRRARDPSQAPRQRRRRVLTH